MSDDRPSPRWKAESRETVSHPGKGGTVTTAGGAGPGRPGVPGPGSRSRSRRKSPAPGTSFGGKGMPPPGAAAEGESKNGSRSIGLAPEGRRRNERRGSSVPRPARDGSPATGFGESSVVEGDSIRRTARNPIPASAAGAGDAAARNWGRPGLRCAPEPEPAGKENRRTGLPARAGGLSRPRPAGGATAGRRIRGFCDGRRDSTRGISYRSNRAFAGLGVARPGGAGGSDRSLGDAPSSSAAEPGATGVVGTPASSPKRRAFPEPAGRRPAVGAPEGNRRTNAEGPASPGVSPATRTARALPCPDQCTTGRRLTIRGAGDDRRDSRCEEPRFSRPGRSPGLGVGRSGDAGGAGPGRGTIRPRSQQNRRQWRSGLRRRPRNDRRSRRPGPTGRRPASGAPPGAARSRRRRCSRRRCTRGGNG